MSSKLELKYRCTHCGKKNLYKTKRKDKKQRHCVWCDRDFDVIPVAKTIREIDEIDEVSTVGLRNTPKPPPIKKNNASTSSSQNTTTASPRRESSSDAFDPYLKWLGIRTLQKPPNHYRLLGLENFESDTTVISQAADRQLSHVRSFQTGRHETECANLLRELIVARNCLLSPHARVTYERTLRIDLSHRAGLMSDVAGNFNTTVPTPPPLHPKQQPYLQQDAELKHAESSTVSQMEDSFKLRKTSVRKRTRRRKRKRKSAMSEMIGTVFGGIAAVLICYVVFRWFISIEPETFEVYQENLRKILD
ncbi:hypothetical protein N9061_00690 [bacterium]|nr:hypothetical protein [bacterium]